MPPLILVLMIIGWVIVLFRPSVGMLGWLTVIFIGIVAALKVLASPQPMSPDDIGVVIGGVLAYAFVFGLVGLILGLFRKDRSAERADKKLDAQIARIRAEAAAEDAAKRGNP